MSAAPIHTDTPPTAAAAAATSTVPPATTDATIASAVSTVPAAAAAASAPAASNGKLRRSPKSPQRFPVNERLHRTGYGFPQMLHQNVLYGFPQKFFA